MRSTGKPVCPQLTTMRDLLSVWIFFDNWIWAYWLNALNPSLNLYTFWLIHVLLIGHNGWIDEWALQSMRMSQWLFTTFQRRLFQLKSFTTQAESADASFGLCLKFLHLATISHVFDWSQFFNSENTIRVAMILSFREHHLACASPHPSTWGRLAAKGRSSSAPLCQSVNKSSDQCGKCKYWLLATCRNDLHLGRWMYCYVQDILTGLTRKVCVWEWVWVFFECVSVHVCIGSESNAAGSTSLASSENYVWRDEYIILSDICNLYLFI